MGAFTKKGRSSAAAERAQRAIDEGRNILIHMVPYAEAEQIEAIEELGWKLEHMSAFWATTGLNGPVIMFLFRR